MHVSICSGTEGVRFSGDVVSIEMSATKNGHLCYKLVTEDGVSSVVTSDVYTVLRVGDKVKAQQRRFVFGDDYGPTTYDLVVFYDSALERLREMNVDMDRLFLRLPDEQGVIHYMGPLPIEEIREKCKAYWDLHKLV